MRKRNLTLERYMDARKKPVEGRKALVLTQAPVDPHMGLCAAPLNRAEREELKIIFDEDGERVYNRNLDCFVLRRRIYG